MWPVLTHLEPLDSHLRHRLAPLSWDISRCWKERHFGIKNQKRFNFKEKEQNASTGSRAGVLCTYWDHLWGLKFPSIFQLCILPGWLHCREGIPSDARMASSPSDLRWHSSVAPMERECLFTTKSSYKSPELTLSWLTYQSPSPENRVFYLARPDWVCPDGLENRAPGSTIIQNLEGVVPQWNLRCCY